MAGLTANERKISARDSSNMAAIHGTAISLSLTVTRPTLGMRAFTDVPCYMQLRRDQRKSNCDLSTGFFSSPCRFETLLLSFRRPKQVRSRRDAIAPSVFPSAQFSAGREAPGDERPP